MFGIFSIPTGGFAISASLQPTVEPEIGICTEYPPTLLAELCDLTERLNQSGG
jgi:hypothetical protein